MLKIKDNVDLKELEKFGFEENSHYYDYSINNYINTNNTWLYISKNNRYVYSEPDFEFDISVQEFIFDILFDLIQAGLVEKVGE